MQREELLRRAALLQQPSAKTAVEFEGAQSRLAQELSRVMDAHPRRDELYPPELRELMRENHVNHFNYLNSVFQLYDPESFLETVIWVLRTYLNRGVRLAYWEVMLPESLNLLQNILTREAYAEVRPFYDWLLEHYRSAARLRTRDGLWEPVAGSEGGTHDG
ncbi:MAG: hypothetical protein PHX58_03155 [Desulfovibrio sp.]|jgi:hypothetical protein|nr:hypothetical protein [Desulfovibrio sp.]